MITFNLVSAGAKASGVFVESENVKSSLGGLVTPRSIVAIGQYNDDKTPDDNVLKRVLLTGEEDELYGRGSMLALSIKKIREGSNNEIPIFALPVSPNGSAVKATGNIIIAGTATKAGVVSVYIGGTKVSIPVAVNDTGLSLTEDLATAINASLDLALTATFTTPNCVLTAKNGGVEGNKIKVESNLEDDDLTPTGLTVTITAMASGAANPDLTTALANLGNDFYTDVHCPFTDSANLLLLEQTYDARISPDFKKPFIGYVPNNEAVSTYLATGTARNHEVVTFIPNFGSNSLPFLSSAYVAGYVARWWQSNPGRKARGFTLPGIRVPSSFSNLSYGTKDQLVKAGCTTLSVSPNGLFVMDDLYTTRKTDALNNPTPDLNQTAILSNLQTKIYSMDVLFSSEPFVTGVVVDDDSTTDLSYAIRPKFVKSKLIQLIDELWEPRALSKNRDEIVNSIVSEIDSGNGGRINLQVQDDVTSPLNILAVKYNWSIGTSN